MPLAFLKPVASDGARRTIFCQVSVAFGSLRKGRNARNRRLGKAKTMNRPSLEKGCGPRKLPIDPAPHSRTKAQNTPRHFLKQKTKLKEQFFSGKKLYGVVSNG